MKLQLLRRGVQILVILGILAVPALTRYNNYLASRELDRQMERWEGTLPGATLEVIDAAMRGLPGGEMERAGSWQRDRDRVLARAAVLRGGAWSAEIAGVSMTDPLAVVESVAAARQLPWVLIVGAIIPVLATLMLGRVFCSWICPMGLLLEGVDKLRRLAHLLEIRPRNQRASRRIKYGLLGTGLVVAAVLSAPVLGYIYPPAILSRELHDAALTVFDRAEIGRFGVSLAGFSFMMIPIGLIALVELTVSRRWWCRYVCPGGALYSLLGWARPVRVRLASEQCTACAACVPACPMGLNPMKNAMGAECDNCGVCISTCNDDALSYGIESPLADLLARRGTGGTT